MRNLVKAMLATGISAVLVLGVLSAVPAAQAAGPASVPLTAAGPHPRLLANAARMSAIPAQTQNDTYSVSLRARLLGDADRLRNAGSLSYPQGNASGMLDSARALLDRAYTLSMAWMLTGDRGYMDRLGQDLDQASALTNWYPDQFLVTAEMTHAFAIAYDWGYGYWTSARRDGLRGAILAKGLTPSLSVYASTTSASPYKYLGNWSIRSDNINIVVNSAMLLGVLAIAKDSPSTVIDQVYAKAVPSLRIGMRAYAADGSFAEGPTYWEYATRYLTTALTSLTTALGSNLGLSAESGFARTYDFMAALTGPSGEKYGFADSAQDIQVGAALAGLGAALDKPEISAVVPTLNSTGFTAQQLVWLDPTRTSGTDPLAAPRDASLGGVLLTARSGTDAAASFVGFKYASAPAESHQHYDTGDFGFQALGQDWAMDLGLDSASYDYTDTPRWQYYRIGPEGHNTLIANPYAATEPPDGTARLTSYTTTPDRMTAVADLTAAAAAPTTSWRRGVELFDGRRQFLVQDEVTASSATELLWAMHTAANIVVAADGRSAMLYLNGQRLLARLLPGSAGAFAAMAAAPLPTSPQPDQAANLGIRKLVVQVAATTSATIAVQFTPLLEAQDVSAAGALHELAGLSTWPSQTVTPCVADMISVDGQALDAFDPQLAAYSVAVAGTAIPTVTARSTRYAVSVQQATGTGRVATATVSGPQCATVSYRVVFPRSALPVAAVTASVTAVGSPLNTLDLRPATYWRPPNSGGTITWRLAAVAAPRSVVLNWAAIPPTVQFQLETSPDGRTWTAAGGAVTISALEQVLSLSGNGIQYIRLTTTGAPLLVEFAVFDRDVSGERYGAPATMLTGVTLSGIPGQLNLGSVLHAQVQTSASGPAPIGVSIRFVTTGSGALTASSNGDVTAAAVGDGIVGVLASWGGVTVSARIAVSVVDPTRLRLSATADGWVQSSAATSVYGMTGTATIKAPQGGSPDRVGYILFDLSQLAGKTVTSAVLSSQMAVTEDRSGTDAFRVDAHAASGTFSESTLTYQNRPTLGATIGSFVVDRTKKVVSADVTAAIAAAGSDSFIVGLTQDDAGSQAIAVTMTTREGGVAPTLDLTFAPRAADPVPGPVVKSVSVGEPGSVEIGGSVPLSVSVLDTLGNAFSGASVSFASSNSAVATVDGSGVLGGVGVGSAVITVTAVSGSLSVVSKVTVSVVNSTKVRLLATADGWVQSSAPTSVYSMTGTATIKAPQGGSSDRVGYALFDLSQLAGKTVASAVLSSQLQITEDRVGTDAFRVDAHTAAGSFSESSLTYQNRPTLGATIGSFVVDRTKKVVSADVTAAIAAAASVGTGPFAIGLTQDDAGSQAIGVTMTTREGGSAPYIDLTLAPAPATAVPGPVLKSVSMADPGLIEKGSSEMLVVSASDTLGNPFSGASVSFASSNSAVATVNSAGAVSGVGTGSAVITVTAASGQIAVTSKTTVAVVLASKVRLLATADGWAQSSAPTTGYSTTGTATIKAPQNGSPDRVGYALFDLSQLAGKTVVSAVFSAQMQITEDRAGTDAFRVDAHAASGTFSEPSLAYQNRPALGDTIGSFVVDRTKKVVSADVTAAIAAAASASAGPFTIGLTQDDPGTQAIAVTMTTREGGSAPYIDVTLAPAPAATVPDPVLKSMSVDDPGPIEKGSSVPLAVSMTDTLGNAFSGASVSFASSNPAVATVNGAGAVSGVAVGSAMITVTAMSGPLSVVSKITVSVVNSTKVRLLPTADGWVQSSAPTTGYSTTGTATIKAPQNGSPDRVGYVLFDLSQLAGRQILSATLSGEMQITEDRVGQDAFHVEAHAAAGTFSETTLTYQNRPALGATIGSFAVDRTKKTVSADITAAIAAVASAGAGAFTIGLTQDDPGTQAIGVTMATRESAKPPTLDIVLAP